jgi:EAL domain-containing protein (putative c-di-GMP-specific phosphodiesterase class I)
MLHYQPQFDLSTGAIQGFEALLRWSNAELGPVSPKEFVPVAETTGLILPIGDWVLRAACAQMKAWRDAGLANGMRIAVNVSGLQFAQHNFTESVAAAIHESGLPPACVELEITESMVMRDEDWANATLAKLKALGVLVAIDDFGTGYSSLSRLRELSVDRLKIDQSFVKGMQSNGENRALVSAIINMARALGVGVIAEGVEDFAQLLQLQDEKCGAAQGFLLGRPAAAVDAEALMRGLAETRDMGRTARLHKTIEWPQTVNLE